MLAIGEAQEEIVIRFDAERERHPRFGTANPERMAVPFWEWMIHGHSEPRPTDGAILDKLGQVMREGMMRDACGPWRARDLFDAPPSRAHRPGVDVLPDGAEPHRAAGWPRGLHRRRARGLLRP
jgi:hypothetical protein